MLYATGIGGSAVCHTGHLGSFYAGHHDACVSAFNTEGGGCRWLGDEIAGVVLKVAR